MARCVILSAVPVGEWAKKLILPKDFIIACDAGYENAKQLGLEPDLILGDFDSTACPVEKNPIVLPKEKDDTDTHYAARLAVQKGFSSVLMLGALGGKRPEHTLANLSTGLWLTKQHVKVVLANETTQIQYVTSEFPARLEHDPNIYFSVFPMGEAAQAVSEKNAKYEVENAELTNDFPVGISNETKPGGSIVSVHKGVLLLLCTQKDENPNKISGK